MPHWPQNLNVNSFSASQLGQNSASFVPHSTQNFIPSGLSELQFEQCTPCFPYVNSSSNALASIKSAVSNPSVVGSRAGAVAVGPGSSCCRRLSPYAGASVRPIAPFPAPAASNAACGFPALRFPVGFMPRVMGPIKLGALAAAAAGVDGSGSLGQDPIARTATAYSISSSRNPGDLGRASGAVVPSFPPTS